ncbi:MAG: hypothetical protein JNK25_01540 [Phycisphaerae bacterium]|nr:hypothetical protein [Phycisphaerae bacterium]
MDVVEGQKTKAGVEEFSVFVFLTGQPAVSVKACADHSLRDVLTRAGVGDQAELAAFLPRDEHGKDEDEGDDEEHAGEHLGKSLGALGIGRGGRIVCSTCRWVAVSVQYQNETLEHRFRPSARVGRVLRWVINKLQLKAEEYDVIKLKLCSGTDALRNDIRLAELLRGHTCSLCFELILTPRVNG